MIATIWAFSERLTPRLASAAISVIFAAIAGPEVYGYYAAVLLVYLGVQAATDSAVRQLAVSAVQSESGLAFLRRYRLFAAAAGLITCTVALAVFACTFMPPADAVALAPVILAPIAWSLAAVPLARLQLAGEWRAIATIQAASTIGSCLVAAPLLLTPFPLIAPVSQIAVSELAFAAIIKVRARRQTSSTPVATALDAVQTTTSSYWVDFRRAAQYSALSWLQGQSDRLAISLIAGPSVLGRYSLAVSLSRNVSDALSIGVVNVLRPQVFGTTTDLRAAGELTSRTIRRGVVLSLGVFIPTLGLSFALPLILGAEWVVAATLVPMLALSALPSLVAWCLTPLLVRTGRMRVGSIGKVVGLLLGLLAAIAAPTSLEMTAWLIVLREVIVATISAIALRQAIPLKGYSAPILCLLACAAISLTSSATIGILH